MTRIYYDEEFLEDGKTIELISIGMVAEDGSEYYAVNADAPLSRKWWSPWRPTKIERHEWLMANVVPHLPKMYGDSRNSMPRAWLCNLMDSDVKPKSLIAAEVKSFIRSFPDPELWAWYGAYDHVALCQLWGRMVDLPDGIPMYTNDLQQEIRRLGVRDRHLPAQAGNEHDALADARYDYLLHKFLKRKEAMDRGF